MTNGDATTTSLTFPSATEMPYYVTDSDGDGKVWVAIHAVTCELVEGGQESSYQEDVTVDEPKGPKPKGGRKTVKSGLSDDVNTYTGPTNTVLTASPIPFDDQLSLKMEVEYASPARIEIFDLNGRLILSKDEYITRGTNIIDVSEVFRIPSKLSIIRVTTDRESIMQKVVSFNRK